MLVLITCITFLINLCNYNSVYNVHVPETLNIPMEYLMFQVHVHCNQLTKLVQKSVSLNDLLVKCVYSAKQKKKCNF